jgi:hypothetical protein
MMAISLAHEQTGEHKGHEHLVNQVCYAQRQEFDKVSVAEPHTDH